MKTELRTSLSQKKTLLIISFLSLLFAALSCLLGDIIHPLLVASLAVLYLFESKSLESKSPRAYSITVSVLTLVINLLGMILGITVSMFAPCAIILSLILCFAYLKGQSKADTAYIMMAISAVFTILSCVLLAMIEQGEYTIQAVTSFYTEMHDSLRALFISIMTEAYEAYAQMGVEVNEELIASVFDLQVKQIISYLLIGAFIIVGLSMKAFSFAVSRLSENKKYITEWRFTATNLFAYFYFILIVVSLFLQSADSLIAISVLNLYNLFQVIFAYIGFNLAMTMLTARMRKVTAFILITLALLLLSSFAMQLLAVMGVMFTLRSSRGNDKPLNP